MKIEGIECVNGTVIKKAIKDMVEESIVLGINELSKKISDMEDEINERVTGQKGGFPF